MLGIFLFFITQSEVIGFLCWLALVAVVGTFIYFLFGRASARWPGWIGPLQIFMYFLLVCFVVYLIFTVASGHLPTLGAW